MPRIAPEKLEKVRRGLVDAAIRCFEAKGLDAATTRDIAAEAGVSNGLLYRYFTDRDALLVAAADRLTETRSTVLLGASPQVRIIDRLATIVRSLFSGTGGSSLLPMLRVRARHDAELRRALRRYDRGLIDLGSDLLAGASAKGLIRTNDAAATAEVVQCLFEGVQARLSSGTATTSPQRLSDAAVDFVVHALAADTTQADELLAAVSRT